VFVFVAVNRNETVIVQTPGAGGYGLPQERSPDAREDDLKSGKFSADFMRKHYS
jgi:N-methylhydantoinase B